MVAAAMIDISVEDLSKCYRVPETGERSRNRLFNPLAPRGREFWALSDVSFEVRRGEALGIVGPNGSGKTTLLKLLSGITLPSRGKITLSRRLSALIEMGAGFHPDLTGRENIFLNGSILGMTYREISRKIPSIVCFSEIGDFLNVPVKKYSLGMFLRLGFSIAIHLDSGILLFDEVLAVGDLAFQTRCFDRVESLRKEGRTVLLISHDFAAIERLCDRALLLRSGRVAAIGDPQAIIENYQSMAYAGLDQSMPAGVASERIAVKTLTFAGPDDGPARTGEPLRCRLAYKAREPLDHVVVSVSLNWPSGYLCTRLSSPADLRLERGTGEIEFYCPAVTMQRGLYSVDVAIERRGEMLDWRPRCSLLRVVPGRLFVGDFYMEHSSDVRQVAPEP
jgi:ABC-type polysaccharide/polyol phosphate transport system ATPase subunit